MANSTRTDLVTVLLVGLAILVLAPMLMIGFAVPMMGGMHGYGGRETFGFIGFLLPLAMLLVILGAGYLLVRRVTGHTDSRDPALEELRSAYARGDLFAVATVIACRPRMWKTNGELHLVDVNIWGNAER